MFCLFRGGGAEFGKESFVILECSLKCVDLCTRDNEDIGAKDMDNECAAAAADEAALGF